MGNNKMDHKRRPLSAAQLTDMLNEAFGHGSSERHINQEFLQGAYGVTSYNYDIYGLLPVNDDPNVEAISRMIPDIKAGRCVIISLEVVRKNPPGDFLGYDPPSVYWVLDFDDWEALTEQEAYEKYRFGGAKKLNFA